MSLCIVGFREKVWWIEAFGGGSRDEKDMQVKLKDQNFWIENIWYIAHRNEKPLEGGE